MTMRRRCLPSVPGLREERKRDLRFLGLIAAALGLLSVAGCATPTTYDWGDYEGSVYRLFTQRDGIDLAGETRRLSSQAEASAQRGRPVPPGVRAHIGYLCFLAGDTTAAAANFEAEKAAFPESAVFVDGMLGRLRK